MERPSYAATGRRRTVAGALAAILTLFALTVPALAGDTQQPIEGTRNYQGQGLADRGPVDAYDPATNPEGHNFPEWYEDGNGLRLELCLDDVRLCLLDGPEPGGYEGNFGHEAFYWTADAEGAKGPVEVLFRQNLEAAYAEDEDNPNCDGDNPDANPQAGECFDRGDEISFARIRIRAEGLIPGEVYKVIHPFGTLSFQASESQGSDRNLNYTEDHGCVLEHDTEATCDFDIPLGTDLIGPFLTWDTFGQPESLGGPPAGYIGDPTVPHAITAGPYVHPVRGAVDFFRIEGPGIPDGFLEMDEFLVSGKVAERDDPGTDPDPNPDPEPGCDGLNVDASPLAQLCLLPGSQIDSPTVGGLR